MKVKIKKTGEIVNAASYAKVALDKCDSYGNPIELSLDEIELVSDEISIIQIKEAVDILMDISREQNKALTKIASTIEQHKSRLETLERTTTHLKYGVYKTKENN